MLNEAQWTAKQWSGGFSVCFFWPASTAGFSEWSAIFLPLRMIASALIHSVSSPVNQWHLTSVMSIPGVSFVRDGKQDWIPVVSLSKRKREKRKERKKLLSLPANTSSSSDSDLNLSPIVKLNTLWLMDLQEFQHKIKLVLSGGLLSLQGLAINSKVLQKNQEKHH